MTLYTKKGYCYSVWLWSSEVITRHPTVDCVQLPFCKLLVSSNAAEGFPCCFTYGDMWVAGKTVWSLYYTRAISECFRHQVVHDKVLYEFTFFFNLYTHCVCCTGCIIKASSPTLTDRYGSAAFLAIKLLDCDINCRYRRMMSCGSIYARTVPKPSVHLTLTFVFGFWYSVLCVFDSDLCVWYKLWLCEPHLSVMSRWYALRLGSKGRYGLCVVWFLYFPFTLWWVSVC